jgi:hypothetical protein
MFIFCLALCFIWLIDFRNSSESAEQKYYIDDSLFLKLSDTCVPLRVRYLMFNMGLNGRKIMPPKSRVFSPLKMCHFLPQAFPTILHGCLVIQASASVILL